MSAAGAYGQRFAERFHLEDAPTIVSHSLRNAEIGLTEIRCDAPVPDYSRSIPREDGYLVALQMRDFPRHEYWEEGRQQPVQNLRAGETLLYDLKRDPVVNLDKPFHSIHLYLPRAAFVSLAESTGSRPLGELDYRPGCGLEDHVFLNLILGLRSTLLRPQEASRTFLDHMSLALGLHVAQTYGGMRPPAVPVRGGLAPWQERRAREILAADVTGELPLKMVADECQLSVSHFARAFRQSVGMAPHRWQLRERVERSKQMLKDSRLTLAEVALACGFADQSHFTRVFGREMGMTPGAWRRATA